MSTLISTAPQPALQPGEVAYNTDLKQFFMADENGKAIEVPEAIARFAEVVAERDALKAQLQVERDKHGNLLKRLDASKEIIAIRGEQIEQIQSQRNAALSEVERLSKTSVTTSEPSRLEIAARIMQGWMANDQKYLMTPESDARSALRIADALIAAAKEVQP